MSCLLQYGFFFFLAEYHWTIKEDSVTVYGSWEVFAKEMAFNLNP